MYGVVWEVTGSEFTETPATLEEKAGKCEKHPQHPGM